MPTPVLLAVDNDEPMDFLTEVRHVVVLFLNIITRTVSTDVLLKVVDETYNCVLRSVFAYNLTIYKYYLYLY